MPRPITHYCLTDHAKSEMARRQITEADVATPEQTESVREGREVYQARIKSVTPPRVFLIRVFVDIDREVVMVYRASKIAKYWRSDI